jgi:predicted dienelactone hydrolase
MCPRSPAPSLLLAALLAVPARAACPPDATTVAFLAPGAFGVGVRTLPLVDATRPTQAHGGRPELPTRTLTTEVWYPIEGSGLAAVRDAPRAPGRFPLIVSSHGYGDLRTGLGYLNRLLASRGYVVAAPQFPLTNLVTPGGQLLADVVNQPADVRFVLDELLRLAAEPGEWLAGGIDARRIGLQGLSLGGLTSLLVGYHPALRDRRVRAVLTLAPYSCPLTRRMLPHRAPLMLVAGDEDLITPTPTNAARTFERGRMQRTLVTLAAATHTAFSGLVTFPSATSYDADLGCAFLDGITQEQFDEALAAFGSAAGEADLTGCTLPCLGPVPATPPMQAARQQELTQALATAFFDYRLRRSRAARCYLREVVAVENPDATTASRPR